VTAFSCVNAADIRLTVLQELFSDPERKPMSLSTKKGVARLYLWRLGSRQGGRTEILSGLKGGELLPASNTYVLRPKLERSRRLGPQDKFAPIPTQRRAGIGGKPNRSQFNGQHEQTNVFDALAAGKPLLHVSPA